MLEEVKVKEIEKIKRKYVRKKVVARKRKKPVKLKFEKIPKIQKGLSLRDKLLRDRLELEKEVLELEEIEERQRLESPYWFYEPGNEVSERGRELLEKYLKAEDILQRMDNQEDCICSSANIVGVGGGNGGGKTCIGLIRTIIEMTGELPFSLRGKFPEHCLPKRFPRHGRIVGISDNVLYSTIIKDLKYWIPKEFLKNGKWEDSFSSGYNTLTFYKNNKEIATLELKTNKQDEETHQGVDLDFVLFDEEPYEAIYKENRMRFRVANRLCMMFCFTPTKGITWSADMFTMGESSEGDNVEVFKLSSVMNPAANLQVVDEQLQMYIGKPQLYNEVKMRLLGEIVSLTGLVYGGLFDLHTHVIEPFFENLTAEKKKDYLCLSGWDLHLTTPQAGVFLLIDKDNNYYADRCFFENLDTEDLKAAFHKIVKDNGYRMGWSVFDKSSNSEIMAFGGRNIYREVTTGKNAIPAGRTSQKYEGSIRAGVDEIKQLLKYPEGKRPRFFIVNRPENKMLIQSFRTMERDTYANEDKKGPKDKIAEGRHHLHAALRYIFQYPASWYPEIITMPEPEYADAGACW